MTSTRGFSIRIFIPSGSPNGVRLVSKSNWCGLGIEFPRVALAEAQKDKRLAQTGVYVLIDPFDAGGLPRVYVGEADDIAQRLGKPDHAKRDFWTRAIAFVSKDKALNKAHAKFIEDDLFNRAKSIGKYMLDNKQAPGSYSLSEEDKEDALAFLDDVLLCLRALGYDGFERDDERDTRMPAGPQPPSLPHGAIPGEYKVSRKGVTARGHETPSGGFLVLADSTASGEPAEAWLNKEGGAVSLRETLIERGVLRETEPDGDYVFTENYEFRSASLAVGIILAGSYSGPQELKDANGRSLRENRERAGAGASDASGTADSEENPSEDAPANPSAR